MQGHKPLRMGEIMNVKLLADEQQDGATLYHEPIISREKKILRE